MVFRYDKVNEQGFGPIYLRLTKNRKINYISTGKRIHQKYWDKKASKVKPSYANSTQLNNYLSKLQLQYEERLLREESKEFETTLRAIKNKITGKEEKEIVDFFTLSQSLLERYYASGQIGTTAKTNSIVKKLRDYNKLPKLLLTDITPKFLANYELYLRVKLKNKTNTVHKDLKFIRRVFNEAYRQGYIEYSQNPFTKYQIKTEKTQKPYLTAEELLALEEVKCLANVKVARDMFIFSAYAGGIRVSDVLGLQCRHFDGMHVHFQIRKTKGQLSIKLPNKALAIIQEYTRDKKGDDFVFPMLPEGLDINNPVLLDRAIARATALINKNLKTVASSAGIEKNLSSHIARHTWATLALKKGISLEKVSRLMGHASVRQTQVYAQIVSEELDKAMDAFN